MPIHVRNQSPVAPVVFLPGDPDRTRWIAENILEDAKLTTDYRQMFGYTGRYRGMSVSIQTTGMGGPSAAIVCEELIELGARFFIRIGTCGTIRSEMNPGDLLVVSAACMTDGTSKELIDSHMAGTGIRMGYAATSDFDFVCNAAQIAREMDIPCHVGKVASLDRFYGHTEDAYRKLAGVGICAVEMEAATVLTVAALHGIRAAACMTVSDHVFGNVRASEETIQTGVERMIRVALKAVTGLNDIL